MILSVFAGSVLFRLVSSSILEIVVVRPVTLLVLGLTFVDRIFVAEVRQSLLLKLKLIEAVDMV